MAMKRNASDEKRINGIYMREYLHIYTVYSKGGLHDGKDVVIDDDDDDSANLPHMHSPPNSSLFQQPHLHSLCLANEAVYN